LNALGHCALYPDWNVDRLRERVVLTCSPFRRRPSWSSISRRVQRAAPTRILTDPTTNPYGWLGKGVFLPLMRSEKSSADNLSRAAGEPNNAASITNIFRGKGPLQRGDRVSLELGARRHVAYLGLGLIFGRSGSGGVPLASLVCASLLGVFCACTHRAMAAIRTAVLNAGQSRIQFRS